MTIATTENISAIAKVLINTNEAHIWKVSLQQSEWQVKKLQLYLSRDELQRARRFFFEKDNKKN